MKNILGNSYIVMNGTWTVDAVKGAFCTDMSVTGPSNEEAWNKARQFAESKGVYLNIGDCDSQGYSILEGSLAPRSFSKFGYTADWDGKVWSK